MRDIPDITHGDPTWQQYERLTVAQARTMSLRELQEHVYWVGRRRGSGRRTEEREPGFPWFPNRMAHAELLDAVGNWASVFDPDGSHPAPAPHIVNTRPSLIKIGTSLPLLHIRGKSEDDLIRGEMVAAAIIAAAGATPIEALRGWGRCEMWTNGMLDELGHAPLTGRDEHLAQAWSAAWGDAITAVYEPIIPIYRQSIFLEVLNDDDSEVDRFFGIFSE